VLAMKVCGLVEAQLHSFLISALEASDRPHALVAILPGDGPPVWGGCESRRRSGLSGVEDKLLPLLGTDPPFRSCLALCVATVPPELSRLSF